MIKSISISLLLLLVVSPFLIAGDCVIPVPGDVNGDCVVDIKDFQILAKNWLKDGNLPSELTLLKVTDVGVTEEQSAALGAAFNQNLLFVKRNVPQVFLNPDSFQQVPTIPLKDPELEARLREMSEVDGESELVFPTLNVDALVEIKPMPDAAAVRQVEGVLGELGLLPVEAASEVDHSTFEAFDIKGDPLFEPVMLDTRVNIQTFVNDIPVLGPGQQHSFSFNGDGTLTQLVLARRGLEPGDTIPLKTATKAASDLFLSSDGTFVPDSDIKLCYYAPPLSNDQAQTLIPHYDIGGTLYGADGQQDAKLRKLVPATDDSKYVPAVQLFVNIRGNLVMASTEYWGGATPYTFQWFSGSADLSGLPPDQTSVQYEAYPRSGTETLTVRLTDANGVIVEATETFIIQPPAAPQTADEYIIAASTKAGTEPDFGVERGVGDLGAANQSGFVNRFQSEGIYKRFNWSAGAAWEQDFKLNGGSTSYIDQADIVFYIGHGSGNGFTFETTNDDKNLTYTDAIGAWGGGDLEWLTLLSCQVLKSSYGGKSWSQRWGPAFNGLHLLCGFQTNAYDWHAFGGRFADWTLGRDLVIIHLPPIPIRQAWFQAKKEQQPSSVEAVVMGPVGPNNLLGGYNDYFWGKGPVSCDLRGSYIRGYWRQVYK